MYEWSCLDSFSLLVSKIFEKYIHNCCPAFLFPLHSHQFSVEINVCFFFAVLEACCFVKGLYSPSTILFAIPILHPQLMPCGKPVSSKGIFSKVFLIHSRVTCVSHSRLSRKCPCISLPPAECSAKF